MKEKRLLTRNIWLLGIVSFLNDLSSEMIAPILPLFITSLGGGGFVVGLTGAIREGIASILKVLCGYLSDRFGKRKIFVASGYFISSLFKLFLSFSKSWPQAVVFSGLERVGKGVRTAARDALIAASLPKERGKGFGIHRSLDTLGAIVGSVVVLWLIWSIKLDFKSVIFIASGVAFLSLFPLYFVKEKVSSKMVYLKGIPKDTGRPLRLFILVAFIFSLANFSYMFFILNAQHLFKDRFYISGPILLYIIFNIFYAALSTPIGILADRVGKKKVLVVGYLLFCLVCLGFAFVKSFWANVGLFALYGVVFAIVDSNQRAFVSELSSFKQATILGYFHTTISVGVFLSNIVAGILWQLFSPIHTFVYAAIMSFLAFSFFVITDRGLFNRLLTGQKYFNNS